VTPNYLKPCHFVNLVHPSYLQIYAFIFISTMLKNDKLLPTGTWSESHAPFRPHCSISYVDATYCYRRSGMVCHYHEPCKNGRTNRDALWVVNSGGPKEACINGESRLPHEKGQFWAGKRQPTVKLGNTIHAQQWCSLLSNYFDHIFIFCMVLAMHFTCGTHTDHDERQPTHDKFHQ